MKDFKGVITALATPFVDQELDLSSFKKLLRHQLNNGVTGFVINGTTGESPALETEEVKRIFDVTASETGDEATFILGTGTNCTRTTIENTKRAKQWEADAALVVVPYYNKPTQQGMVSHFKAVAESTDIPILLYNVPGRTVVGLNKESILELAVVPNIIGIKEASGDIAFFEDVKSEAPEDFIFLSGDDDTWMDMHVRGGDGVISVISHVTPGIMNEFVSSQNRNQGDVDELKEKYMPLMKAVNAEANPIGVKMALHKMGIFDSPELRLPMTTMTGTHSDELEAVLKKLELLK